MFRYLAWLLAPHQSFSQETQPLPDLGCLNQPRKLLDTRLARLFPWGRGEVGSSPSVARSWLSGVSFLWWNHDLPRSRGLQTLFGRPSNQLPYARGGADYMGGTAYSVSTLTLGQKVLASGSS